MKVSIFGASGFVGTATAEHLLDRKDVELNLFIRSFGNSWRLTRSGIPLKTVDITSLGQVREAIGDSTHVVNCTRGPRDVMIGGLQNLLAASKAQGVKRFIHLSSDAVYGDRPPPESERESAPAQPGSNIYGQEKLRQDDMVASAASSGLDCVVLCPPNISGVYSSFVSNVLADMRAGTFALVDGGKRALNVVDVDNLAYAIMLALEIPKGDGRRIFVTDGEGLTWKDLADSLLPLAELKGPVPNIPASSLPSAPAVAARKASLWRSAKHLVSSDVREVLRRDPLLAKFDVRMRKLARVGGRRMEDRLRDSIEGPIKVAKVPDRNPYSSRYNAMQLRDVWRRIDRARETLGYRPVFGFSESMARFRLWYETMHGVGEDYWPLARTLNDFDPQLYR
jgi:nucleoside-diphosphate-sugar epimerase